MSNCLWIWIEFIQVKIWLGLKSVVTCFFLDTTNNIFKYIETIKNAFKSNGISINYRPLLFHYSEMQN